MFFLPWTLLSKLFFVILKYLKKFGLNQIGCLSAGLPPTQLHKYGHLGSIDLAAVLEPLDFLLPQKEPPVPEVDITAELSSLAFDTEPKEPAADPNSATTTSDVRDSKPGADKDGV